MYSYNGISEMHDALIKEAFIGAVAGALGRGAMGVGKFVVKNPFKTLGAALTVSDVGGAAAKGARQAAQSSARNVMAGGLTNVAETF